MGNVNNLEDLLFEIHQSGVFEEVMEEIKQIKKIRKHVPIFDLYEMAFENIKEKIKKGVDFSKK
jgi:hypothetical protein